MEITKGPASELGGCQFCSRQNIFTVYELGGKGITVRCCTECLNEAKTE